MPHTRRAQDNATMGARTHAACTHTERHTNIHAHTDTDTQLHTHTHLGNQGKEEVRGHKPRGFGKGKNDDWRPH